MPTGEPTFGYSYEDAVSEAWLAPFEAYHARTRYQLGGIHGTQLPEDLQQQLIDEGADPADIDLAGTEIERRWTNTDTTRLIVREFFEKAITDPAGSQGKSIIFAVSHAHARRVLNVYSQAYVNA